MNESHFLEVPIIQQTALNERVMYSRGVDQNTKPIDKLVDNRWISD